MAAFSENLFGFDRPLTSGESLHHRAFEAFVVYWVIYFAWSWGLYIDKISDVVLPLGIAEYIDISFMFNGPAALVNAGLMTGTVLMGFFGIWRYGYLASLLFMHVQYVARFCLGEISHGSNIAGICLLGLALGALAFETRTRSLRFAMGFGYFTLGLGYTSAALCKLIGTGPHWVDGSHLWMWIAERTVDTFSMTGAVEFGMLQELALASHSLATAILAFGLLTELFGFLTWFPRARPYIAALLFSMHVGILLTMNINFPANNVAILVLGFPWDRWANAAMRGIPGLAQPLRLTGGLESQEG
ncbi:MAG: hypothetical protein SH809_17115 [Rhodothermales bacterium]|nr:hypothetical protein [Rhodothermales bacterium]